MLFYSLQLYFGVCLLFGGEGWGSILSSLSSAVILFVLPPSPPSPPFIALTVEGREKSLRTQVRRPMNRKDRIRAVYWLKITCVANSAQACSGYNLKEHSGQDL